MPRKPRYTEPGTVYHLISRFVDRSWFFQNDDERSYYLRLLGRALAESDWRSLGYALMSSHIHHAVVSGTDELHEWVRRVHSPFADWLNRKYGRIGTVFVRGPKQLAVDTDRVGQLLAYIHNNPVRAGVVSDAQESNWTSHRAYLGLDRGPRWLRVDDGLALAGFHDHATFDAFVRLHPKDPTRDYLRDRRLVEDPDARLSFHRPDVERRVNVEQVLDATARILGVEPATLRSRRRTRRHIFLRHVVACAADRVGISGVEIAKALGMSQQGVSFILNKTADKVVDTTVDRVLAGLDDSRGVASGNW